MLLLPSNFSKEPFWISSDHAFTEFIVRKDDQAKTKGNEVVFNRNLVGTQCILDGWDVVDDEGHCQPKWNSKVYEPVILQKIKLEKTQVSCPHGHQVEELHDNQVDKVDGRAHVNILVDVW